MINAKLWNQTRLTCKLKFDYDSILSSVRNEGVTWDAHARCWSVYRNEGDGREGTVRTCDSFVPDWCLAARSVFHLFWRWRPVARASYQPQNAAVLKCSRPRTSDTEIWASRIVTGPYFSALLPRANKTHKVSFHSSMVWYLKNIYKLHGKIKRKHNTHLVVCHLKHVLE